MHFCEAKIVINEGRTIVWRDRWNPVSWPELEVIRQLHGSDAVRDVKPFVAVEQDPVREVARLRAIYGTGAIGKTFGSGRSPIRPDQMESSLAKDLKDPGVWKNPISGLVENKPEEDEDVQYPATQAQAEAKARQVARRSPI